jgi:hypothetical protein
MATHGSLRAANGAHPRRARCPVAISSHGAQKVSVSTLLDAPLRCFREKGASTTMSSSPAYDYTIGEVSAEGANNYASYRNSACWSIV